MTTGKQESVHQLQGSVTTLQGGQSELRTEISAHFETLATVRSAVADLSDTVAKIVIEARGHSEGLIHSGLSIAELRSAVTSSIDELRSAVNSASQVTSEMASNLGGVAVPTTIAELNARDATMINFAAGHRGYASQSGLWINQPISLEAKEGSIQHADSNERLLELPFVMAAISGLRNGKIVDVGGREGLLALHLASSGYEVTVVDPRGYGFVHPRLRTSVGGIEDLSTDDRYDAVIFLSTIEHIGIGAYGIDVDTVDDHRAFDAARRLLTPKGTIILTVPYGVSGQTSFERTYSRQTLLALLGDDANLRRAVVGVRKSRTIWDWEADELIDVASGDDADRVAMVVVDFDNTERP